MKKTLFVLLSVLVLTSMLLSGCGAPATATQAPAPATQAPATQAPATQAPATQAPTTQAPATQAPTLLGPVKTVKKIAFFVSDLSNTFHQAQAAEAVKYAKAKYGVDVTVFDGKANSATMTANIDQVVAQGMDAATLHIWDEEAAKPGVEAALAKGIIMTAFFSPVADTGIPTERSDEVGVSHAMGAEMATQWKAAFPDKPIVMVEEGWPNNPEVKSGRTDPFVQGVWSVDPTATDLGCLDVSAGADEAKQVTTNLITQHPKVNLMYVEAGDQAEAAMVALQEAGRGKFDNGKPLTEIVAGVDFDATQLGEIYDPNTSLKLSMGLPPIETADARIDLIMQIAAGKVAPTSQPEQVFWAKAFNMSYWTMPRADAVTWMNTEFGTSLK